LSREIVPLSLNLSRNVATTATAGQPVRMMRRLSSASLALGQQKINFNNSENIPPSSSSNGRNATILGALSLGLGTTYALSCDPQKSMREPPMKPAGPIPLPSDRSKLADMPSHTSKDLKDDVVHDKLTNIAYPRVVSSLISGSNQLELIGVATRTVTLLNFYVYTAGLYASISDLRSAIAGTNAEVLRKDIPASFMDRLFADPNLELALRIVPYRVTQFAHLRDGFCRAIESRVQLDRLSDKQKDEFKTHLSIFQQFFPKSDFQLTDELLITKKAHMVFIHLNGKLIGSISSPLLGECLFRSYMDDKPVSSNLKTEVMHGFHELAAALTPSQALH
jgi:hypothetical protein